MTLDAGALIAAEKNPVLLAELLETARRHNDRPFIPAVALAQAWRGPRAVRVALLLNSATVEELTERRARAVGELLARSGTADVVDAAVALSAASRRDLLLTSDPADMNRLRGYLDNAFTVMPV